VEEAVRIPCGDIELEGRLSVPRQPTLAVVVCHPHPLMGGDMNSPPVAWVRQALAGRGAGVLRFNFRGTGRSGGRHGKGVDELRDVAAALDFLAERMPRARLALAGYSFGAMMAARSAAERRDVTALGLIAPPCATAELPVLSGKTFLGGIVAVVGDHDEHCPVARLREWTERCEAQFEVLAGEDHFLAGARERIEAIFAAWLAPDAA
jgi:alpha/beta superfamily hydrolase